MSSVGPRFHDRVRRPMTDSAGRWSPSSRPTATRSRSSRSAAGRYLRALALSTSHPMMTEKPMPPKEIAALFLHGVGKRPPC